jgi:hypoxanthine phosphoribosyltransferase
LSSVTQRLHPRQRVERILDRNEINKRVAELGRQITRDYTGRDLVLVGVLKGCAVFLADLMRQIDVPLEVEFISAASYRKGKVQDDKLTVVEAFSDTLTGRDVLLVEGIVETGRTAQTICSRLMQMEPASVEIVSLLDKPTAHRVEIEVKYRGFAIGNEFVIGYGLDNTQKYRNLPYIGRVIDGR